MAKTKFEANGKVINFGDGKKLQFNTSLKSFRDRIQLFADGINKMNDKRNYYSDCINVVRNYIEVYKKGAEWSESVVNEKLAEIETYKTAVAEITADIQTAMPEWDKTDKNLYYAYRQYMNDEIEYSVYERAFAEWLDNGGIVPTKKGIEVITNKIGVKKASAKTMCKNGGKKFTSELGVNQYLDLVYRVVCNMMYEANALKEYTYEYIPVSMRKKEKDTETTNA